MDTGGLVFKFTGDAMNADGQYCRPNDSGFCDQHPTCGHVTAALREAQDRAEALRRANCELLAVTRQLAEIMLEHLARR